MAQSAGFPGQPDEGIYISNTVGAPYAYQVVPKSVGEYTGLKVNNGDDIYENDIVEVDTTGMNYHPEKVKGVIKSIDGCFTVEFLESVYDNVLKCMRERLYVKCFTVNKAIRIIGNTYDNSELIQKDA